MTLEHVVELRDKQRSSYAVLTFSEKVEEEMIRLGYKAEALWCRLMRNFYDAVDTRGISVNERIEMLLSMRQYLLSKYKPNKFPPPASHVGGLPVPQFEGLLCNIDRRIQLYKLCMNKTYNHRSIASLDAETFFGCFQVIQVPEFTSGYP